MAKKSIEKLNKLHFFLQYSLKSSIEKNKSKILSILPLNASM